MERHIRILGILHIVYAGFILLCGAIVLVVMGGIAGFLSASDRPVDTGVAPPILALIGVGVFVFLMLLSLPGIISGFGLLAHKEWARILTIVLSAFELLSVPLGTALGIYGLWVLLNREAEIAFQRSGPVRRVS